MWFIWIAQDIHRICYVYNYGPPRGKAGQRMRLESWVFGQSFARRRLAFSYCLNVDPRFFPSLSLSLSLTLFFFCFSVFKVSESVARPRQNPDRTAFRNRALIIYPGSEDFVLKIQFPCYRQIFVRRCASPRFRPRSPCTWPRLPTSGRLLYYRKYLSSSFFLSSPLFIYLFNCLDTSIRYTSDLVLLFALLFTFFLFRLGLSFFLFFFSFFLFLFSLSPFYPV